MSDLWYCPACDVDVRQWGGDALDDVHRVCGERMALNGTMHEACARLENAVRDLGREMFGACTPMVEWLTRRRTMQRLAERVTR